MCEAILEQHAYTHSRKSGGFLGDDISYHAVLGRDHIGFEILSAMSFRIVVLCADFVSYEVFSTVFWFVTP
jgi:hypothetical protein